jgi:hypothetical protein
MLLPRYSLIKVIHSLPALRFARLQGQQSAISAFKADPQLGFGNHSNIRAPLLTAFKATVSLLLINQVQITAPEQLVYFHHRSIPCVHAGWVGDARNHGPVRSMLYTRQTTNCDGKDRKFTQIRLLVSPESKFLQTGC